MCIEITNRKHTFSTARFCIYLGDVEVGLGGGGGGDEVGGEGVLGPGHRPSQLSEFTQSYKVLE